MAALYVERGGVYFGLPDVDPWDEARDARRYAGPWPVVAHPPCARWCALAHLNQKRYGHKVGDDGGCFESALRSVRAYGGVLEHPAFTHAWPAFGLPRPQQGCWTKHFGDDGWVAQVSQACYGHAARKLTWLYCVASSPPALDWRLPESPGRIGPLHGTRDRVIVSGRVSWLTNHGDSPLRRVHKGEAKRTPPAFRDLLLSIARTARPNGASRAWETRPSSRASVEGEAPASVPTSDDGLRPAVEAPATTSPEASGSGSPERR